MAKKKGKKNIKKRKLKINRVILFLMIFLIIILMLYYIFTVKISNIYIRGNSYLSDQQIIDLSGLNDYPKSILNPLYKIEKKLTNNEYILLAKIEKNIFLNKVYIEVKENYPLFYYESENKTVLYNGEKTDDRESSLTLINKVPDKVYEKFIEKFKYVNREILDRMSEIEYKPNEVDQERFFVLMDDGNHIYFTVNKLLNINKYLDMISSFNNKKGILYLDSGEYFDLFDE